eukprot:c25276_g3_i15 orf=419-676(+)
MPTSCDEIKAPHCPALPFLSSPFSAPPISCRIQYLQSFKQGFRTYNFQKVQQPLSFFTHQEPTLACTQVCTRGSQVAALDLFHKK